VCVCVCVCVRVRMRASYICVHYRDALLRNTTELFAQKM